MSKFIKSKLIALHKWTQKKWIIIPLITSTIGVWFTLILNYMGHDLNLVNTLNNTRILTWQGWTLTAVVVGFTTILVIAQRVYEYEELNNNRDRMKLEVLNVMSSASNELCDIEYATLKEQIKDIQNGKYEAPQIISNPKEQLKHIIKSLNESLCTILSYKDYKIKNNEMYVCLHYNFPTESEEWYLAESIYAERNISNKDLLGDNSTFNKVLTSKEDLLFFNSKEEARKQYSYVPDSEDHYDEQNNLKGSIACYRIQVIHHNKTYVNAIISFVTYSKKLVNNDDRKAIDTVKYNIKESILSVYKKRISIELCLLYVMKIRENQHQEDGRGTRVV
jgi:hypothetical protein